MTAFAKLKIFLVIFYDDCQSSQGLDRKQPYNLKDYIAKHITFEKQPTLSTPKPFIIFTFFPNYYHLLLRQDSMKSRLNLLSTPKCGILLPQILFQCFVSCLFWFLIHFLLQSPIRIGENRRLLKFKYFIQLQCLLFTDCPVLPCRDLGLQSPQFENC